MLDEEDDGHARLLGAEIRRLRLARGMSLRKLAKALGLSGHGTLVDYEHGRRIPPEDLIVGCERVFEVTDRALQNLRYKALAERADRRAETLLSKPHPVAQPPTDCESAATPATWPAPTDQPEQPPHRDKRQRRWIAAAATLSVIGLGLGVWRIGDSSAPPAPRAAPTTQARTPVAHWGICWGGQVARIAPTDAVTFAHADSLQITVDKPNSAGDFAVCTIHGLGSLRTGMKVTVMVRSAEPEPGSGLGFFVYNSSYTALWAPQTPKGDPAPLPAGTGWQQYSWTVPKVDKVLAIGMDVFSVADHPLILWLGAASW